MEDDTGRQPQGAAVPEAASHAHGPAAHADENQVCLVTGASSGIGSRFAVFLATQGAKVVLAARREEKLQDLVDEITQFGGKAESIQLDVSAPQEEIAKGVQEAWNVYGHLDVLLNNAGFASGSGLLKDSQDDFDKVFSTNVRGLYFTAQAVAKLMVDNGIKGRIINTSSIAGGELVQQGQAIYSASKAAVIQITRAMAVELAPKGINVNSIAPGVFPSPMSDKLVNSPNKEKAQKAIPCKRYGDPERDMMGVLLLLASEKASQYMCGVNIPVDGGITLYTMNLSDPTAIFEE